MRVPFVLLFLFFTLVSCTPVRTITTVEPYMCNEGTLVVRSEPDGNVTYCQTALQHYAFSKNVTLGSPEFIQWEDFLNQFGFSTRQLVEGDTGTRCLLARLDIVNATARTKDPERFTRAVLYTAGSTVGGGVDTYHRDGGSSTDELTVEFDARWLRYVWVGNTRDASRTECTTLIRLAGGEVRGDYS